MVIKIVDTILYDLVRRSRISSLLDHETPGHFGSQSWLNSVFQSTVARYKPQTIIAQWGYPYQHPSISALGKTTVEWPSTCNPQLISNCIYDAFRLALSAVFFKILLCINQCFTFMIEKSKRNDCILFVSTNWYTSEVSHDHLFIKIAHHDLKSVEMQNVCLLIVLMTILIIQED